MSITRNLAKTPMFTAIDRMEDELFARSEVLHPSEESPERFEIMRENLMRGSGGPPKRMLPIMLPTLFGIRKSLSSLQKNPTYPKTHGSPDYFEEIKRVH